MLGRQTVKIVLYAPFHFFKDISFVINQYSPFRIWSAHVRNIM